MSTHAASVKYVGKLSVTYGGKYDKKRNNLGFFIYYWLLEVEMGTQFIVHKDKGAKKCLKKAMQPGVQGR